MSHHLCLCVVFVGLYDRVLDTDIRFRRLELFGSVHRESYQALSLSSKLAPTTKRRSSNSVPSRLSWPRMAWKTRMCLTRRSTHDVMGVRPDAKSSANSFRIYPRAPLRNERASSDNGMP